MNEIISDLLLVAGINIRPVELLRASSQSRIACHREYAMADAANDELTAGERAFHAARAAACTAVLLLSQECDTA